MKGLKQFLHIDEEVLVNRFILKGWQCFSFIWGKILHVHILDSRGDTCISCVWGSIVSKVDETAAKSALLFCIGK